jgi:hypothetical protein
MFPALSALYQAQPSSLDWKDAFQAQARYYTASRVAAALYFDEKGQKLRLHRQGRYDGDLPALRPRHRMAVLG